jgi:putative transposase
LDKLVVKICDEGFLRIKAVFIAVDVGVDGSKDVLGVWIQLTTACSTRRRPP